MRSASRFVITTILFAASTQALAGSWVTVESMHYYSSGGSIVPGCEAAMANHGADGWAPQTINNQGYCHLAWNGNTQGPINIPIYKSSTNDCGTENGVDYLWLDPPNDDYALCADSCPEGSELTGAGCSDPTPTCEEPLEWVEVLGMCYEKEWCEEGYLPKQIGDANSGVEFWVCYPDGTEPVPEEEVIDDTCPAGQSLVGYGSDGPLCADSSMDECINQGGTFTVHNGVSGCLPGEQPLTGEEPPEEPPTVPTCNGGEYLAVTQTTTGHTYSCKTVQDTPSEIEELQTAQGPGAAGDPTPVVVLGPSSCTGADCGTDGSSCTGADCTIITPGTSCSGPDCSSSGVCVGTDCTTTEITKSCTGVGCDATGECTGQDCTSDEVEGEISDGCVGDDCEQGIAGGGNCDPSSQPTCTGKEPILCAVAVQTWKTNCSLEKAFDNSEFEDFVQANQASALYGEDEDLTSTLSGVFSTSGSAGSCPPPYNLSLLGSSHSFNYQPICDVAEGIRPIILVIFSLFGFRILMRAF